MRQKSAVCTERFRYGRLWFICALELSHIRLYSTRLLVQYQLAQLRHRIIRLRQVRHNGKEKPSREEELTEFPFKMRECEAMLTEPNDEFDKPMEIVRGDP